MAEVELPNPEELREHASDRFTKMVALTVACYAVILAVTALGGNNAAKDAMLAQQKSSNQWAYFQAKSTREYITRLALERLKLDKPDAKELVNKFESDANRYETEKKAIEDKARELENERDHALKKDPYFDYAEVLLQIAIVLASVAMLAKSKAPFLLSLLLAGVGSFLCLNGYLLLFKVPFLSH